MLLHNVVLDNGSPLAENLIVFAEPQEENAPVLGTPGVVNIMSYSPDNTGKKDTAALINSVIRSMPDHGTLYFPPGTYLIDDSIKPKSNTTLYLAPGAEILQNARPYISSNLIDVVDVYNVKLLGRGRINGNGILNREVDESKFGWYAGIYIRNARNITVEDITNFNPAGAGLWAEASDTLNYYNWKVISELQIANSDGMDFWSSRNATVDNVFVKTTDDFGNNASDPYNLLQADHDIEYTNFVDYNTGEGGGIAFGTHVMESPVYNIKFENGDMIKIPNFFRILSYAGGTVGPIYVNNITVEDNAPGLNLEGGIGSVYHENRTQLRYRLEWSHR